MTAPAEAGRVPNDRYALLLVPLAAVLVALLMVFFVLFHYTTVAGESMEPTLLPEDRLLLTKGYDSPHRGDIVVFRLEEDGEEVEVVKRVVAIPGDMVLTRGDRAFVNGEPESAGFEIVAGPSQREIGPMTVPEGSVFVMGDNRMVSLDSRFIGYVRVDSILGRAVAIFSPVTRLRMIPSPG